MEIDESTGEGLESSGEAGELAKKKEKKIPKRGERERYGEREVSRERASKEFLLITSFYYKRAKAAHKQTQKKRTQPSHCPLSLPPLPTPFCRGTVTYQEPKMY